MEAPSVPIPTIENFVRVYDKCNSKTAYLPLQIDANGVNKGLALTTLTNEFPRACGLYLEDSTQKRGKAKIAFTAEPIDGKSTRDFEIYIQPKDGWKFNISYLVDYEIAWDYTVGMGLSGGGFRATLFHLGALRRLNELRILQAIDTFSSVSGGSIINAVLATAWTILKDNDFSETAFDLFVAQPVNLFCDYNFATKVLIGDKLNPVKWVRRLQSDTSSATFLAEDYAAAEKDIRLKIRNDPNNQSLFSQLKNYEPTMHSDQFSKHLSEALPDPTQGNPLFIFCGSDMRNGCAFYFSQKQVGSDLAGATRSHTKYDMSTEESQRLAGVITLAQAVAASSAFPLAFQPLLIPYTNENKEQMTAVITDGGVYDNIGLDPLLAPNPYVKHPFYKEGETKFPEMNDLPHQIVFVSDAGAPFIDEPNPSVNFNTMRVIDIMGSQSIRLRQRLLLDSFKNNSIYGAMWGLDDLWQYFSFVRGYAEATTADAQNEVKHALSANHMNYVKDMLDKLPSEEDFPNLEKMFGFNLTKLRSSVGQKQLSEGAEKATAMIEHFTSFRTDLNRFTEEEKRILEAIGYTLTAYRYRIYCSGLFTEFGSSGLNNYTHFNKERYSDWLTPEKIQQGLKYSSSLLQAKVVGPFWRMLGFQ